jgi:uncharacterized protein YnzC (UPF0291/DUF896 family)
MVCGEEFEVEDNRGHRKICSKDECKNKRKREYSYKWNHSEKGKLASVKYLQSEKGKLKVQKYYEENYEKIKERNKIYHRKKSKNLTETEKEERNKKFREDYHLRKVIFESQPEEVQIGILKTKTEEILNEESIIEKLPPKLKERVNKLIKDE